MALGIIGGDNILVEYNTFFENPWGITLEGDMDGSISLHYNNFEDSYIHISFLQDMPMQHNYWGTTDCSEIEARMPFTVGLYEPFLDAPYPDGEPMYCLSDSDGDGIPDDEDACPYEDATGFDADQNGCIDTLDGLQEMIETLPDDVLADEIKNSLVSKVNNALNSVDKEKDDAAINMLEAFINQIGAQSGKKISTEVVDMITTYVNNIIAQIITE